MKKSERENMKRFITGKCETVEQGKKMVENMVKEYLESQDNSLVFSEEEETSAPTVVEPIWEAAVAKDWHSVKEHLQRDPTLINVTGDYRAFSGFQLIKLPLFHLVAMLNPDIEFLQYLVSQGADLNALSEIGATPIHYAARNSTVEVLEYLISLGGDVHAKNKKGATSLHYAAGGNFNVDVLQFLVSHGVDVNASEEDGWTPLHNAALGNSNIEVFRYLVSQGADVNAKNKLDSTPLNLVRRKNTDGQEITQYLISQGAEECQTSGDVLTQEEVENLLGLKGNMWDTSDAVINRQSSDA